MAIKKELIQFTISNETDCSINLPLFQQNVYSVNATTKYSWDITAETLSCGTGTIVINGNTINLTFTPTLSGLLNALNALGFGFFCTETSGGNTFLYVVDDTNVYGGLDLCPVETTTTTTTTTLAPETTTTTTTTTLEPETTTTTTTTTLEPETTTTTTTTTLEPETTTTTTTTTLEPETTTTTTTTTLEPETTTTTTTTTLEPETTTTTTTTTLEPETTTTTTTTTLEPETTTTTTTTTVLACNPVTAINVSGTSVLGEPTVDVTVFVQNAVTADTLFDITVVTDYGTDIIGVTILNGNTSGNTAESIAPSGSDPIIISYCISAVDNNTISCAGYNCLEYNCPCGAETTTTTTTTTLEPETTTTTTTTTILYDVYLADRYDCGTCTLAASGVLMALPQGTTPVVNDFYLPSAGSGEQGIYVYKLLSLSSGAGLICDDVHTNACSTTCSIIV